MLSGYFTLRTPLSHIGASESTYAEFVRWPVIYPDGVVVDLPVYSGNAWRGQLRDSAATYLLQRLDNPSLSLDAFHLLYSGGRIGGEADVNLQRLREVRRLLKPIELLGGGIGNQIVPGKLRVSPCYPVCREAQRVMAHTPETEVNLPDILAEVEQTRRDDSKDPQLARVIALPAGAEQMALLEDGKPSKHQQDGPAQQMRYTVQVLAPGTVLETRIWLMDGDEVLLGCLVSALWQWSLFPHLGGKCAAGFGEAELRYDLVDLRTGEIVAPFFETGQGMPRLSAPAAEAKTRYDEHCRALYDALVAQTEPEIRRMLAG
jgi:hypothetical protein